MTASLQLRLDPMALLNQLFHLDAVQLTVRGDGASLLKPTEFGLFFPENVDGQTYLHDAVSGLSIDPQQLEGIYAIPLMPGYPPSLEFLFVESGFALSIQAGRSSASQVTIDRILHHFSEGLVPTADLIAQGAGAWLDEWTKDSESFHPAAEDLEALRSALTEAKKATIDLQLPGLIAKTSLRPDFIDQDDSVMRIACPETGAVLYVELNAPTNRFDDEGAGQVEFVHQ